LDDARVAAGASAIALEVRREELLRHLAVIDVQRHTSPRIDVVGLGVGDHALDPAAQLLRLCLGRANPAVAQQRGHLVARHRLAMRGAAPEDPAGDPMPHGSRAYLDIGWKSVPSSSWLTNSRWTSFSLISSSDFCPKL